MIHSMAMTSAGEIRTDFQTDDFGQVLKDPQALLWVDLSGESGGRFEPILRDIFGFHPLAIDDALVETHIPKVDDWGEFIYVVLHGVRMEASDDLEIFIPELDIFLGRNFIVTHHNNPLEVIDIMWEHCQRDRRFLNRGTGSLFYHLADELVNQYLAVIERMDESIDDIEDKIFDNPQQEILNQIFHLKRALLKLRRSLLPQREVFNKLARGDFKLIQERDRVYFRDVYDHMVRFQEINENLRDLISGALDTYLSVVNNRMNDIMKTLTVITTLFMPLSFLTGFFGMNFFQAHLPLDTWTGQLAFKLVLAGLILIPVGMYLWMRRRAWM
jgi:magnesium transporter